MDFIGVKSVLLVFVDLGWYDSLRCWRREGNEMSLEPQYPP